MENSENRGVIEIDLKRLLTVLWSRLWIILLTGVLFGGIALGYAWFFVTPTYSASTQLYVNNQVTGSPGFSSSQIAAAQNLADTYMVILESRSVLDEVAKRTGLSYSYEQLRKMVVSGALNETEVFQVDVICTNYQRAAQIANAIADVLPDKIAAVVDGSSVRVVDRAVEDPRRVGPSYRSYALLGAVLGCAVSMVLILAVELMDTTVNSEDYLTQVYGKFPLLAVIPGADNNRSKYQKYRYYKGNYESPQKKAPPKKPEQKNGGAK